VHHQEVLVVISGSNPQDKQQNLQQKPMLTMAGNPIPQAPPPYEFIADMPPLSEQDL
jgi:hypothetical protein